MHLLQHQLCQIVSLNNVIYIRVIYDLAKSNLDAIQAEEVVRECCEHIHHGFGSTKVHVLYKYE